MRNFDEFFKIRKSENRTTFELLPHFSLNELQSRSAYKADDRNLIFSRVGNLNSDKFRLESITFNVFWEQKSIFPENFKWILNFSTTWSIDTCLKLYLNKIFLDVSHEKRFGTSISLRNSFFRCYVRFGVKATLPDRPTLLTWDKHLPVRSHVMWLRSTNSISVSGNF